MTGVAAAAARLDVEMEVVAMVVIVAGAEHGGEIVAAVGAHRVQETARTEGKQPRFLDIDVAAVRQLDAADVERVAGGVLGHRVRTVDAAAGIAGELMDGLDPAPVAPPRRRIELVLGPFG